MPTRRKEPEPLVVRRTAGANPVRVALVEGEEYMREGLAVILERGGCRITAQVADVAALTQALVAGTEADLALVGVPPGCAVGEGPVAAVRAARPALPVIALVESLEAGCVVWAYRSGMNGVVSRCGAASELVLAVKTVALAGLYHTPATQQILLENPDGLSPEERQQRRILAQLPDRSLEVLELLCQVDDLTYERMGKKLGMARRTVEDHVDKLREAFGVRSKTALAIAALRLKIVRL